MLVSLVAVFGCAPQPVPRPVTLAPPRPAGHAAPSRQAAAEAVLTTTASALRQEWYLFRAQQQRVAQCMHSHGLRYFVASAGPEPAAGTTTVWVAGRGRNASYDVTVAASRATTTRPEDQYVTQLPTAQRSRYTGVLGGSPDLLATLRLPSGLAVRYQTGGCVGGARAALFGSVRAAMQDALMPEDVDNKFYASLAGQQPYLSAVHAWQRCMAAAGWHFMTPQASIAAIQTLATAKGTSPGELRAREAAVAGADVACDGRAHLRMRTTEALAAFVRTLPGPVLSQLRNVYLTRQQAAAAARRDLPRRPG